MMTEYETLATELDADGILLVTLDRPDHLNAFSVQMARELEALFRSVNALDEVRAIVVTGSGRAFCAGMDLAATGNVFGLDESLQPTIADIVTRGDEPAIRDGVRDTGGRVALAIYACTKPVVAAINGAAVGIGATMLLPMDARIASTDARIGFIFGRIGITPEACSTWFLPRLVGLAQALDWFYSADILTAQEAQQGGLLQDVVAPDELIAAARKRALRYVNGRSPIAVALTRQMTYRNCGLSDPFAAHAVESLAMFYESMADGKEGVEAFREKRPANFTTRVSRDMPPFYPWQGGQ